MKAKQVLIINKLQSYKSYFFSVKPSVTTPYGYVSVVPLMLKKNWNYNNYNGEKIGRCLFYKDNKGGKEWETIYIFDKQ